MVHVATGPAPQAALARPAPVAERRWRRRPTGPTRSCCGARRPSAWSNGPARRALTSSWRPRTRAGSRARWAARRGAWRCRRPCPALILPPGVEPGAPPGPGEAPYAHVACCIDASPASMRALAEARRLRALGPGRLSLVHVAPHALIEEPVPGGAEGTPRDIADDDRAWLAATAAGVPGAEAVALTGLAADAAVDWAARGRARPGRGRRAPRPGRARAARQLRGAPGEGGAVSGTAHALTERLPPRAEGLTQAEAERRLAARGEVEPPTTSRSWRSILRANLLHGLQRGPGRVRPDHADLRRLARCPVPRHPRRQRGHRDRAGGAGQAEPRPACRPRRAEGDRRARRRRARRRRGRGRRRATSSTVRARRPGGGRRAAGAQRRPRGSTSRS